MKSVTEKKILVRYVASKSRVASLAKHSIPRLELLSATVLARLSTVLQLQLP